MHRFPEQKCISRSWSPSKLLERGPQPAGILVAFLPGLTRMAWQPSDHYLAAADPRSCTADRIASLERISSAPFPITSISICTRTHRRQDYKDFCFVVPAMAAPMEGETYKAALVLCVNSHGVPFFWPVRALDEDRANAWTESAHTAVKLAVTKWVKIRANQKPGAGYYDVYSAKGDLGEPEFPATDAASYLALLNAATPPERKIGAKDHPIFFRKVEGRR